MNIDTRPCNMVPEGNSISPRSLSVNAKEMPGIFLIILLMVDKTSTDGHPRMFILHPVLKEAIIFVPKMAQK